VAGRIAGGGRKSSSLDDWLVSRYRPFMPAYIHAIETLVPPHCYSQSFAAEQMTEWLGNLRAARMVRQIYRRSGIAQRYSVLPDFQPGQAARLFGETLQPGTRERNRCYIESAGPMFVEVARRALAAAGVAPADVTHVVTVSCTGFYNPGPDCQIVTALGLADSTERYHLGFMGCYGAFPALRMADQFCRARPEAVVLVVCLELCSLHLQIRDDPNALLANALFADGAAAAVVSARPPAPGRAVFEVVGFHSALAPAGAKEMTWEIGNQGFDITLSSYVPGIIGLNVAALVDDLLVRGNLDRTEIARWAIHPGGKAILDKVTLALGLEPAQVAAAREVLRDYGNMSSATILFVLRRLLETESEPGRVCAMAFGPGLVLETALLALVPASTPQAREEFLVDAVEFPVGKNGDDV